MLTVDLALEIAAGGLPVFPCKPDKKPAIPKAQGGRGFHDASTDPDTIRRMFKRKNAVLVGVPTGERSGFDVLDVDYRHGGGDWEEANAARLPETRMHQTQHGGRHYLMQHAPGVRNSASKFSLAPGIDVRGDGGYVILPPCQGYTVISDAEIAHWPDWLLALVLARPVRDERPGTDYTPTTISSKRIDAFVRGLLTKVSRSADGAKHVTLRNMALSFGGIADLAGIGREEAVRRLVDALPASAEDLENARATAQWGFDRGRERPIALDDRADYQPRANGTNGAKAHAPASEIHANGAASPGPETEGVLDWRVGLLTTEKGNPRACLANVLLALTGALEWQGVFALNEFSSRVMVQRELPGHKDGREPVPRELADVDISSVTQWMQTHQIAVSSVITREAVIAIATQNKFHPVRNYLDGLVWDGIERLNLWLVDHLGVENCVLHHAFARKWMIGMVARVMRPGCQFDTALILESRQGLRKSTALRVLTSPWFTDHLPDLGNKDALAQLQGVWLVELAELSALGRAETHRVKSFLTTRVDRFRPSYGYAPGDFPRQCGFAGTVNPGSNGYLRDETGGRRFWTVACGFEWPADQQINTASIAAIRDQLWAEASVCFKAGESWWLDSAELERDQAASVDDRLEDDPRERKIYQFIQFRENVHMDEILGADCLKIPPERWSRGLRIEIGLVMSSLKWRRKRIRIGNHLEWLYFPSE